MTMEYKRNYQWNEATAWEGALTVDKLGGTTGRVDLSEIAPTQFFTVTQKRYGLNLASAQTAINDAIEEAASVVTSIVSEGETKLNTVAAAIFIQPGVYHLTAGVKYRNGVSIFCAGVGAVEFVVDHDGYGFEPFTIAEYSADIHIRDCTFVQGAGLDGLGAIRYEKTIRNCVTSNVRAFRFPRTFYFKDTWTNILENCNSYKSTGSHIYGDLGTGILTVRGGRYDECTGGAPGVYMNTLEGQLNMRDCAVQFGEGAAMELNCPNIDLNTVFIEGNCISLTETPQVAKYHVEAKRPAFPNNPNSSFVMTNCVINNRGNVTGVLPGPWRDGLGIVHAENFRRVEYRDCWVRNTILDVPVFLNCDTVECVVQSASGRSPSLSSVGPGLGGHVLWQQGNRPIGLFGQDMASDGTYAPTTRAAVNIGFDESGLALGTHNLYGAIQGYGTTGGRSNQIKINPWGGDVFFGSSTDAKVEDGTNEFWGRGRSVQTITSSNASPTAVFDSINIDCTGGGRTVTLTNAANLPLNGRRILVRKLDATPNRLNILHENGSILIDGQASIDLSIAGACVILEGDGTNFNVIASHGWTQPLVTTRTGTSATASATLKTRYTGTGGHTEALPAAVASTREIRVYRNCGTGAWSLVCAGADQIDIGNPSALATTLTILPGQTAQIYVGAAGLWEVL